MKKASFLLLGGWEIENKLINFKRQAFFSIAIHNQGLTNHKAHRMFYFTASRNTHKGSMYLDARVHTLTFKTMLQKSESANQKSGAKKFDIKGMNYSVSQLKPQ